MDKNQPNKVREKKSRKRISKKTLVFIIGSIIAFLALLTLGLILFFNQQNKVVDKTQNLSSDEMSKLSTKATVMSKSSDSESVAKLYDDAADSTEDVDQKITLLLSKSAIYYNDSDFDKALEITKDAEKIKLTLGVADYMAKIYSELGEDENAIIYLNKAIDLLDKSNQTYAGDLKYYESQIEILSEENFNE